MDMILSMRAFVEGAMRGSDQRSGELYSYVELEKRVRLDHPLRAIRGLTDSAAYKLLIIDELGYVPLSTTGAELLFEVFSQRYERGSTLVTSNLPFDEWTGVFGSERLTGALLDCPTHQDNS